MDLVEGTVVFSLMQQSADPYKLTSQFAIP